MIVSCTGCKTRMSVAAGGFRENEKRLKELKWVRVFKVGWCCQNCPRGKMRN